MPTLDWIGKKAVLNHHREVPYHLLKCDKELSVGDPGSGNLLIQGDNLLALKALLPYYAGRVKCIYIDPPYNTGDESWIYNDAVNSPEMRAWLGRAVGKETEDLSRHDKWLCMMYPRLTLLKDFLNDDGAIFVSIDDNAIGYLRLLLDEVFGPLRFVATIAWQKRYSRENRAAIGDAHEYVVVYAKDPERFKQTRNPVPLPAKSAAIYKNPNNDPRGPWQSVSLNAQGWRPNQMYTIVAPSGKEHKPPDGRCWSVTEPEYKRLLAENRIWFGKDGNGVPRLIRFLSEVNGLVPWTWWPHDEVGHTDEAKKEIRQLLDTSDAFPTPKPVRLIRRILEIATDKDSLILDSFTGSGTTGQAALELNKSDGGNRRFLLVEMEESICREATAKRLGRVVSGYSKLPATGGGFCYCTLAHPLFDERGNIRDGVTFADLAAHVYFTETGEPIPKRAGRSPLLGIHNGRAICLLFNGVLGDKRPDSGNVLTSSVLKSLPQHHGPRVVYGEGCRLSAPRLKREGVAFKQVPYGIKVT